MRLPRLLIASALIAWACGSPASGPTVIVKNTPSAAGDYFDWPWPDDRRLDANGDFIASDFPNPHRAGMFESVKERADGLQKGWSISAPIYVPLSGAIDTSKLPTDPGAFLASDAPFFLAIADATSPVAGRRMPLEWRYQEEATPWLPAHTLIIRPLLGFTLEPATRYALVVTTRLTDRSGVAIGADASFSAALQGTGSATDVAHFRPVVDLAAINGLTLSQVAGATVFTTQDGEAELRELRDLVESMPAPTIESPGIESDTTIAEPPEVRLLKATYTAPNFMFGKPPYASEGGELRRDANGRFLVGKQESMRLSICLPRQRMPAKGFPIVYVSHGTGGDWHSYIEDGTCQRLASFGIATVGIDNVLHGPRAEGVSTCLGLPASYCFFNPVNVVASRNLMRQAAIDHVSLRKLGESLRIPAGLAGASSDVRFDHTHPGFFGHSQGGLTGSLYLAIDPKMAGGMLSGSGGHITTTVLERADSSGVRGGVKRLVETLMYEMQDGDELDQFHPALAILQMMAEVADPLTYSRSWLMHPQGRRKNVLLLNGTLDENTPIGCAHAYALSAGIAPYERGWDNDPAFALAGLTPVSGAISDNIAGDGSLPPVTAVFRQFPGADHYPAFTDASAVRAWTTFLSSLVTTGKARVPGL